MDSRPTKRARVSPVLNALGDHLVDDVSGICLAYLNHDDIEFSEGRLPRNNVCSYAARGGCLEVLQWARVNDCPWSALTCSEAAGGGHLKMLQWAIANGCSWDETTCSEASCGGHLDVLKWARVNGCPWDEMTLTSAADGGHLEVLKWARANGCPE